MSRARIPVEGFCPNESLAAIINCGRVCLRTGSGCLVESDVDLFSEVSLLDTDADSANEEIEIEAAIHTIPLTNRRFKSESLKGQGQVAVHQRGVKYTPKITS